MSSSGGYSAPSWWPAPAKLNLFLHITGRRDDGYHVLQSAFQLLDYHDDIQFAVRSDGLVHLSGGTPEIPTPSNLVVKAARRLQTHCRCHLGADIVLRKRIPVGAGLGGGSSDAATTLVALNILWQLGLGTDELAALGLELGADVPVFLRGASAWAEGVGEELSPLELAELWYLVLYPNCAVATGEVFADPTLTRNSQPMRMVDCLTAVSATAQGKISPLVFLQSARNDCEALVRQRYRAVDEAFNWLSQYGQARLTGTGAAVFVAISEEEQARQLLGQVPSSWQGFVARGINQSPLRRLVDSMRHSG